MKFGLESEKFLFDLKKQRPSNGVFRFIDALTDYETNTSKVTNEFVLNMVEIICSPSENVLDVIKEYVLNYLMFNSVAKRESVTMVGMGSMPMDYQPHMTPKWQYLVQNSILKGELQDSWMMTKEWPLTPAGNCAGIHVHSEIETLPEYLFSTNELQDKFNLALMLTPMIAFASSPYFFGEHSAFSMRGESYYNGLYVKFPKNGQLPPVMQSSADVLNFFKESTDEWVKAGEKVGLPLEDLKNLTNQKGASWNPVRWNRKWNTIELRCLDSDRIDLDCSKFVWVTGAMKRSDLAGEALKCKVVEGPLEEVVNECFHVENGFVSILSSESIFDLFQRAIKSGLKDPVVHRYLMRLKDFAKVGVHKKCLALFHTLESYLEKQEASSDILFKEAGEQTHIVTAKASYLVQFMIDHEEKALHDFIEKFPDVKHEAAKYLQ